MPAANGLLENTDSHASQSEELGRQGGRIWREAAGRVVFRRETYKGTSGREGEIKVRRVFKATQRKRKCGRAVLIPLGAIINTEICNPFSLI